MKNYLILNEDDVVVSSAACADDVVISVDTTYPVIQVDEDVLLKYTSYENCLVKYDKSNDVVVPIKQHSNLDWSFISYSENSVGNARIDRASNGEAILTVDNKIWMRNSKHAVLELLPQYTAASGDVVVGGLGLGIVALLAATKPDVTSVTVLENNQDVIDLFYAQEFNTTKIKILNESVYTHEGKYDVALMDYYNDEDMYDLFLDEEPLKITGIEADTWKWYLEDEDGVACSQSVVDAIAYINDNKCKAVDILETLSEATSSAVNAIRTYNLPVDEDTKFIKDYFIYNLDTCNYQAVGVTWEYFDKIYSVKYQHNDISDFYEIYKEGDTFSSQLDMNTHEVICNYLGSGDNKTDLEGNVLQVNHRIESVLDLCPSIVDELTDQHFPYIANIFYYSEKPYGRVVECSFPSELR